MKRRLALAVAGLTTTALVATPTVAMAEPGTTSAPPETNFQKVTLNDHPGEPMDLAVLPDSRVLHVTRPGEVWLHDPATGRNTVAATLDVYRHDEEGLQNVAIDPNFGKAGNNWVYLYYSPPMNTPVDDPSTPNINEGDAPAWGTPADFGPFKGVIRLSRFRLVKDKLDLSTEQQILDVPIDRGICCHVGGDIVFDAKGNLYLSTGDDTNPFESGGYTPIDERPGRNPAYDAQRSAANTNDLRGKILRIKVRDGGGYTIPDGNLFPAGTPRTRPEIYLMGLRNPFRIEFNRQTDELYVADYSPDAGQADPQRGPAGQGKWAAVRKAGNYGWPYCATAQLPYVDYDFATGQSGAPFNCSAPINESPHNTGLRELPPVQQPDVWYGYGPSAQFPELGTGGIGPMAGPAYHFASPTTRGRAPVAWPAYYDGIPLFHEWTRDYVKGFRLDSGGDLSGIEPVLSSFTFDNPMDLEFGPDGALYVLEYGDGFFSENPDAQLARIDYTGWKGNHTPVPQVSATPTNGLAPLTVTFESVGTTDYDGDRLSYAWDLDNDGKVDSHAANPTFTYQKNGLYNATLKVSDPGGLSASASVRVVVGNAQPVVELVKPVAGQPFKFGDTVQFEVRVTDDQPVDCSRVSVTYVLGHDTHGHPQTTANGCTGSIQTTVPSGHDPANDHLTAVFVASYTDAGGNGLPALTGSDQVVLVPTA
ncbi:PQQ-dependent sugar dehydrogenase [Micromonospora inositola]|uniref:Glucose/arabinose dehydrogenase, beta-propeller fold n=1 Tax=Micromonospora inositola TaxID=47865 RepID=A0A1C5K2T7_9ACTN|nr:PQQ-dependent sugar dehydrogenase [Micromonospora inositola]SCG77130.1 Glucose/arabinose dehydrogenase, beta-propeller fold [Micromonospora inositola]